MSVVVACLQSNIFSLIFSLEPYPEVTFSVNHPRLRTFQIPMEETPPLPRISEKRVVLNMVVENYAWCRAKHFDLDDFCRASNMTQYKDEFEDYLQNKSFNKDTYNKDDGDDETLIVHCDDFLTTRTN